jgi:hypothetical protein
VQSWICVNNFAKLLTSCRLISISLLLEERTSKTWKKNPGANHKTKVLGYNYVNWCDTAISPRFPPAAKLPFSVDTEFRTLNLSFRFELSTAEMARLSAQQLSLFIFIYID